ncbi:MAG: hypothetical protein IVW36_07000 [Dehalococcoidia bacterium]|nr:hypothetical protein [Dehalococcoidia bacterium]
MRFEDGPQLPLSARKRVLLALGMAMFAAQTAAALIAAPRMTGTGATHATWLLALWAASIAWSALTALLVVRQADLPDIATASFVVTIAACASFALSAAFAARGTSAEVNLVDALFIGVTGGGLTSVIVWGLAMLIARALRLPTTEDLDAAR